MTKKHAHEQLNSFTGAFVKLRGIFKQLGARDPNPNERKLHLFITAGSPESLQNALNIVRHWSTTGLLLPLAQPTQSVQSTLLQSQASTPSYQYPNHQQVQHISQPFTVPSFSQLAAPQYQDQRFAPQSSQLLEAVSSGLLNLQQKSFVYHARVSIGALAGPNVGHPGFSVKNQILGSQGQNIKHITAVTGAKVQLKGRGSSQSPEADGNEDTYLDVNAYSELSLNQAVDLATNLVETVRLEYIAYVTKPLQHVVQSNGYSQLNAYSAAPQQYYSAPYPPMSHNHSVAAPRALPVPLFPPPPVLNVNAPARPMVPMSSVQHPALRASSAGPTPSAVQSKGCVPFMYPDGDAVIRTPNPFPVSADVPPQPSLRSAPDSSEGKNSTSMIAPPPPRLSLNGSTFEARILTKADHSSTARSSSSGNDRQHRSTSNDSRSSSSSSSSSSGSNKRRRGFQESVVYTAPVDCPLPTTLTHQAPSTSVPAINRPRREPLDTPSDAAHRSQVHAPPVSEPAVERILDLNGTHAQKGPEPASNVMAALAAMTERRLQAKMSRPAVPSFSSVMPPPERPPVPSFTGKPAVPLIHGKGASGLSTLGNNSDSQSAPAAASFKLPGLTAYEDDDDED